MGAYKTKIEKKDGEESKTRNVKQWMEQVHNPQ